MSARLLDTNRISSVMLAATRGFGSGSRLFDRFRFGALCCPEMAARPPSMAGVNIGNIRAPIGLAPPLRFAIDSA